MRNLYDHHFTLKPGTRVFVPTAHGRALGERIKKEVSRIWKAPGNFFHLVSGGHVSAARSHMQAEWLASLDIKQFFDQVTRTKVHRSLKTIGVPHLDAWEMACDSTVDKMLPGRAFSLPFGFVQSPLLASVVLAQSALGRAIRKLIRDGLNVSVYVDDITISGVSEKAVIGAVGALEEAAEVSGFLFNPEKTQLPSRRVVSFNIEFGLGYMEISEDRMAQFEIALRGGNEHVIEGILGYISTVNIEQYEHLAR